MIVEREHILNARRDWKPAEAVRDHKAAHAEKDREMAEFLARGGVITIVPFGEQRHSYEVEPSNGDPNSFKRRYKDKGVRIIMENTTRLRTYPARERPKRA